MLATSSEFHVDLQFLPYDLSRAPTQWLMTCEQKGQDNKTLNFWSWFWNDVACNTVINTILYHFWIWYQSLISKKLDVIEAIHDFVKIANGTNLHPFFAEGKGLPSVMNIQSLIQSSEARRCNDHHHHHQHYNWSLHTSFKEKPDDCERLKIASLAMELVGRQ